MNAAAGVIEPGCSVCTTATQRHGRVEISIGVSRVQQSEYFRCVACDTYWSLYDRSLSVVGEDDIPDDLQTSWRDDDGNLREAPLPPYVPFARHDDLPTVITTSSRSQGKNPSSPTELPFTHDLIREIPAGPLASRIALCVALARLADVLSPPSDASGTHLTFQRVEYVDTLGHLHVGYGAELNRTAMFSDVASRVRFPTFVANVYSATPRNHVIDPDSGALVRIGPGAEVDLPGRSYFNALLLDGPP